MFPCPLMPETEHPFWQFIRKCNALSGKGPLEYEPLPLPLIAATRHKAENPAVVGISFDALALLRALDGNEIGLPLDYDMGKHQELFQFVSGTPLGTAVGYLASRAMASVIYLPSFSHSLHLPEFPITVLKWMDCHRQFYGDSHDMDWNQMLAEHWNSSDTDPIWWDYILKDCQHKAPDSITFTRELAAIVKRRDAADLARMKRDRTPKSSRFKVKLLDLWMIAALWCRSSHGILQIIEPEAMTAEDVKALETDVSRLHLSDLKHPEHEERIKNAEADFRQFLDSVKLP